MSQHGPILSTVKPTVLWFFSKPEDEKWSVFVDAVNKGLNEQLQIIYFTLRLSFGGEKKKQSLGGMWDL